MRTCTKREVTEAELSAYISSHPDKPTFDGMRWTYKVPMGVNGKITTVWNKPVAYQQDGKFYVIEDK